MRSLFASVTILSLSVSSLLLGGCTAKSLEAFEGEEQTLSEEYAVGQSVTISGVYGDIFVTGGEVGALTATFQPFSYRGHDEEDQARDEMENNLDLDVSSDASGVSVSAGRHDATNGLGAHITVALPPEFNGILIVQNDGDGAINQGSIDVSYVAEATTLNVINHGLENCNILRGNDDEAVETSTLIETDVRCEADITVRGISDNVFVHSVSPAFHSHVRVEMAAVSADATGGEITGDNSTVEVLMPAGSDFNLLAVATGSGGHVGDVEAGDCSSEVSETSVEMSCGAGGPVYNIEARDSDADDDDEAFVNVLVY